MGKPSQSGLYLDYLADFAAGMNSNPPPVALPKNQAAFATNCTMRGTFVTHRPPYQDITLDRELTGLWQGACYYKPDFGSEQLICSISGNFYAITPGGALATVSDITPTTPNNTSLPQAWFWQAENYVLANNGTDLTFVYNGNSSRRADPGTVVGTLSSGVSLPAEGATVAIALTGNYSGTLGQTVYLYPSSAAAASGQYALATVQITSVSSGGFKVLLENVDDTPGASHPSGTDIITSSSSGIFLSKTTTIAAGSYSNFSSLLGLNTPYLGTGTVQVTAQNGLVWTFPINQSASRTIAGVFYLGIALNGNYPGIILPTGNQVIPSSTTNTTVATLAANFIAPNTGAQAEADVTAQYTGTSGLAVTIEGKNYKIYPSPYVPSSSLYMTTVAQLNGNTGDSVPSGATLKTIAEIPIGAMGVYGMGRNWIARPNRISYVASDIVGGNSGTIGNNFRDSILNVTENSYLAGGGVFRIPSAGQQINAMAFPSTLDSSLGQGPLQVLTQDTTFSCNAPVERLAWQEMANPIQTQSLVGGGALSFYGCVAVNGDLWFRSDDGIRSLKLARQDFQVSYANTPQSVEMNRVILADDKSLLNFCSAVVFDNRLLMTASPTQTQGGVVHGKIIALNLDPNSNLREKLPPIYDGAWEGLNVLQLVVGTFSGVKRCFAFTYDSETSAIGLSEILLTSDSNSFDNGDSTNGRIQWSFESPAVFYQPNVRERQLLRLNDGELVVKDLQGTVRFDVFYRPDYSSAWVSWRSWEVPDSPTYQPRMGLGQPNLRDADESTGRPYSVGYNFQLKIVVTGHCTIMGVNLYAVAQDETQFAKPMGTSLTPITP